MTKKKTVLIVEDEPLLSNILAKQLQKEGFNIIKAKNGKLGLKALNSNQVDLILLDILMPIMDGKTFLKNLTREQKDTIPIIVLTNLSQSELPPFIKQSLVKSQTNLEKIISSVKNRLKT